MPDAFPEKPPALAVGSCHLCYFVDLMLTTGIVWTIHLWLGSCIMAGVVGLMLSYLLVPPQGPTEKTV